MKLVVQRVKEAGVKVAGDIVGEIRQGLFILVGVREGDTVKDAQTLAIKISKLRVISDGNGKMNLSVLDTKCSILVVSQFTLHADMSKGNRPSFTKAADPKLARDVYDHFVSKLKDSGIQVETGEFGAYMKIGVELDGPVTIIIES